MNHYTQFFGKLTLVILFLLVVMNFVHTFESLKVYSDLSYYSIIMFSVMSIVLYILLRKSLLSADKQIFTSITLTNMLIRMLGSITLLLFYKKIKECPDNKFIISFLVIYVIFTIFETYFMVSLADQKPKKNIV